MPDRQCRTARTPYRRPPVQPLVSGCRGRLRLYVGAGARRIEGLYLGADALLAASHVRELRQPCRPRGGVPAYRCRPVVQLYAVFRPDTRLQGPRHVAACVEPLASVRAAVDRGRRVLCLAREVSRHNITRGSRGRCGAARPVHPRRRGALLLLGGGCVGIAVPYGHTERRDADSI